MKLNKETLKQIIKEEMEALLNEMRLKNQIWQKQKR
jgi:predicted component of type VI protein secretion system